MRIWLAWLLAILLAAPLTGCARSAGKHSVTYWDTFDTVISITGYAQSRQAFDDAAEQAHQELIRLHKVFDRYHDTPDLNGLFALNTQRDMAGPLDEDLTAVLQLCEAMYDKADRKVDPSLGNVIDLWNACREDGKRVPTMDQLRAARGGAGFGSEQALGRGDVIDLGAVAKGYAVEKAAAILEKTMPSFLIDGGGNVRAGGAPLDGRDAWTVGLTDPRDPGKVLLKLRAKDVSIVTSGGYQRYYEVNGVRYHHIIDPDTLMPGDKFLQTTAITKDSGLADYLSTALFLMDYERGRALVESMDGVDATWVLNDGSLQMTDGASALIQDGA